MTVDFAALTDTTPTPVTLTRYGVIAADEALAQAVDWHPYEAREDADTLRRDLNRKVASGAPYRTIRIDMMITEEGTE